MKQYTRQFITLFPVLAVWLQLPAFTGWVSLAAGILCGNAFPALRLHSLYNDIYLYAIILLILTALICKNRPVRIISFFLIGYAAFALHESNYDLFARQLREQSFIESSLSITGKVLSPPLLSRDRYTFLLKADELYTRTDTLALSGKICKCTGPVAPPPYGTVTAVGAFRLPQRRNNPYAWDENTSLRANNIYGRFRIDSLLTARPSTAPPARLASFIRATVLQTIAHVTNPALQGILQAVFLGEKNNLTTHTRQLFRNAGIYHLLAISGLHVAILISSVWLALSLIPVSRVIKILATISFIWCYLFFIGFIPSLFRAVIMATLILLSTLFQRNNHVINALGVAGIIWLIMSPYSLLTPGFQLSFAATFGIVTLFPVFKDNLIPASHNEILALTARTFLPPFFVSLAGFIATLPIIARHFGRIAFFGLVANIFAVFLMGLAMNTFFVGIILQMLCRPLALIAMRITEFFLSCIHGIAGLVTAVPWSSVEIPAPLPEYIILFTLAVTGFAAVNRRYRLPYLKWTAAGLFCLVPAVIFLHTLPVYTEITFFSARGKPAAGIRFPNRKIWLILPTDDRSPEQTYTFILRPWLRRYPLKNLDAVVTPAAGINIIHDLNPICADESPAYVITGTVVPDTVTRENLRAYLQSLDISYIQARNGTRFIPARSCTCTVRLQGKNQPLWYESPVPAVLDFSCNGVRFVLATGENPASLYPHTPLLRIDNTAALYNIHERALQITGMRNTRKFNTDEHGAVIVRIYKNGTVKVRSMTQ